MSWVEPWPGRMWARRCVIVTPGKTPWPERSLRVHQSGAGGQVREAIGPEIPGTMAATGAGGAAGEDADAPPALASRAAAAVRAANGMRTGGRGMDSAGGGSTLPRLSASAAPHRHLQRG